MEFDEPFAYSKRDLCNGLAGGKRLSGRPPATMSLGSVVYGAAAMALGCIGFYRGDFIIVWHPVPDDIPGRQLLAYMSSTLFIGAGIGLQWSRTRPVAGAILAVLFLLFALPWLTRVILLPGVIGTWLGLAEQLALSSAGLVLLFAKRSSAALASAFRTAWGVFEIIFGLAHFLSFPETVAMTPPWLPLGGNFWAVATGIAHLVAGAAFVIGVLPSLAAAGLAAMFTVFGLLVWFPKILADPSAAVPWAGCAITLALTGAVLVIFDLLRARDRARQQADSPA